MSRNERFISDNQRFQAGMQSGDSQKNKPFILFLFPGPIHGKMDSVRYEKISSYFRGAIFTSSPNEKILEKKWVAGFRFHCVRFQFDRRLLSNIRFFTGSILYGIQLARLGEKVDLVVTYDPLKTGMFGVLLSKMLGAGFAPEVNGVYTSPDTYMDEKNHYLARMKWRIFTVIEKVVLRFADGIKALYVGQLAPFEKMIKNKVVHCFSNMVDVEKFASCRDMDEENIILLAGFPFKVKGVDILISAFKKIADRHPKWKLKILGWYPNPEILNNAIGGHRQIFHHPPVLHDQMPYHIGSAAIVVLPSRSEAMGRILAEAMSAGKAVIGSRAGGIPHVIRDGIDGLLFEKGNASQLAEKLETLMNSPELRKKLGTNAGREAWEKFHPETYSRRLINFYNEVLDR